MSLTQSLGRLDSSLNVLEGLKPSTWSFQDLLTQTGESAVLVGLLTDCSWEGWS